VVAWACSLAAAGICPGLVLGIWWERANTPACIVGMILGFGICLYYLVGTRYFAVHFYETWSWLSNASPAAIAKFNELKAAWMNAADGAARDAALVALDKHAQTIANWWGVRNISAAIFGLPVGFLAIWIVSLLTPEPSKEVQEMVDATRRPRGQTILRDKDAPAVAH